MNSLFMHNSTCDSQHKLINKYVIILIVCQNHISIQSFTNHMWEQAQEAVNKYFEELQQIKTVI